VTAVRLHPGLAVLATVTAVVSVLLLIQGTGDKSVVVKPRATVPAQTSPPKVPLASPTVGGIARVIDGDTIDIGGTRIRLDGIDAPESKQTCQLGGESYACGQRATEELITFMGARPVECTETGKDRNRRTIAKCRVNSIDVGTWMVEHGWAVAFRKYSLEYVGAEDRARAAKLGMWAGTFALPEEYRKARSKESKNGQQ
jgi:endonuclease YncB( thermonuclease family)